MLTALVLALQCLLQEGWITFDVVFEVREPLEQVRIAGHVPREADEHERRVAKRSCDEQRAEVAERGAFKIWGRGGVRGCDVVLFVR